MNMKLLKKDRRHLELSFLKKFTYFWHKGCCMSCKNHPCNEKQQKASHRVSFLILNSALWKRNDTTAVEAINFIDVQTRVTARFEKASIWAASFSPSKFNYDRNLIRMNCLIMNLGTYGWLNTHLCRVFCDFKDIVLKSYLKWWKVNSDKFKFRFKDKNKILKLILYTFLKFLSLNVRGIRNREKKKINIRILEKPES